VEKLPTQCNLSPEKEVLRERRMRAKNNLSFHLDCYRETEQAEVDFLPHTDGIVTYSYPLDEEFARGCCTFVQIQPEIGYAQIHSSQAKDRMDLKMQVPSGFFKITLTDSPDITKVGIENYERDIALKRNDSYLLSPAVVGTMTIEPGTRPNQTSFLVSPQLMFAIVEDVQQPLESSFETMLKDPDRSIFPLPGKVTPAMQVVMNQIRNCRMRGSLQRFYMEGKVIEFIALRIHQLCGGEGAPRHTHWTCGTRLERERIHEAREILAAEMYNPPSIYELARRVGLNTTKLKNCFKDEFNTTIFGYVHLLRMEKAILLLRETEMTVSEVAWELGYSSTSAFSAAFKRGVGYCPSLLNKEIPFE
jgi:AraC-like DNA-binding protein